MNIPDAAGPDIVRRDGGSWLVDGSVAPGEFRAALSVGVSLPGVALPSVLV